MGKTQTQTSQASDQLETLTYKVRMDQLTLVRFQLTYYTFVNKIRLSPAQLDTLALLAMWGEMNISDFCEEIVKAEHFTNPQTVRNFITQSIKNEYVLRKGVGNKLIELNPSWQIHSQGNVLITIQALHVGTVQS